MGAKVAPRRVTLVHSVPWCFLFTAVPQRFGVEEVHKSPQGHSRHMLVLNFDRKLDGWPDEGIILGRDDLIWLVAGLFLLRHN